MHYFADAADGIGRRPRRPAPQLFGRRPQSL